MLAGFPYFVTYPLDTLGKQNNGRHFYFILNIMLAGFPYFVTYPLDTLGKQNNGRHFILLFKRNARRLSIFCNVSSRYTRKKHGTRFFIFFFSVRMGKWSRQLSSLFCNWRSIWMKRKSKCELFRHSGWHFVGLCRQGYCVWIHYRGIVA
jgi:hypothetical protein